MKRTRAFFRFALFAAAISAMTAQAAPGRRTVLLPGGVPLELAPVPGGAFFGVYEVTQRQWESVMGTNPSHFRGANLPVENVSFSECEQFVLRLNNLPAAEEEGFEFRIPEDADWTAACLAGKPNRTFHLGYIDEAFLETAWTEENSGLKTHPVGEKKPNEHGLYDMYGNVGEWACTEEYVPGYIGSTSVMGGNVGQSEQFITAGGDPSGGTVRNKGIGLRVCAVARNKGKENRVRKDSGAVSSILSDLAQIPGRTWRMGRHEVTQKQWVSLMGDNPSFFVGDDIPVNRVSLNDAVGFLAKLNAEPQVRASGLSFRLPTADEWREACLAGSRGKYGRLADGTEGRADELGVCGQEGELALRMSMEFITVQREADMAGEIGPEALRKVEPKLEKLYRQKGLGPVAAGTKRPNAWGLYDMIGNVAEWTSTRKNGGYKTCGGSAMLPTDMCTAGSAQAWPADERNDCIGFRLCADVAGSPAAAPRAEPAPEPAPRKPEPVESAMDPSLPLVPVSWPEPARPAPPVSRPEPARTGVVIPLELARPAPKVRQPEPEPELPAPEPEPVSDGRTVVRVVASKTPATRTVSGTGVDFFPVGGATLGRVAPAELVRLGGKRSSGQYANQCVNYSGLAWWDHDRDGVCEGIFTTCWQKMPAEWIRLGMEWGLSHDEWTAFFRNRGFSVETKKAPTTKAYQGRTTLTAEFVATAPDGKLSFDLDFDFGNRNGEGFGNWSRNSLYSISVKAKP